MCPPSDGTTGDECELELANGRVRVRTYGHGPRLLVAWHGYGFDGSAFANWEEALGSEYTICAPDLPFHGESSWKQGEFTPKDIQNILDGILARRQAESYSLVGHSLGARLVVCNAPDWDARCERYILLAPAGIGSFDRVPPRWMQQLGETALRWTSGLRFFVNLGHRLGLVSNFHRRYAEVQLYPPDTRNRLFRVYNSLRHLRTTRADRKRFWAATTTPTLVVLASQDRFVPNAAIREYFSVNDRIEIKVVKGNHDLVNGDTAEVVRGGGV